MSSITAADDTELAAGAAGLRDRVISVAYNRAAGLVTPHFLMLSGYDDSCPVLGGRQHQVVHKHIELDAIIGRNHELPC